MLSLLFLVLSFAVAADAPAPALIQFEQRVVATLAVHADDETKAGLRREFQTISTGLPLTPPNNEIRGRVLVLLGDANSAASLTNASLAEGRRLLDRQDYAGALAYANAVLASDPSNAGAVALKKMSEGRSRVRLDSIPTSKTAPPPSEVSPNSSDSRPYKLESRIQAKVIDVPSVPGSMVHPYVSADAKPPSTARKLWDGVGSMIRYNLHRRTPEEVARIESVKRVLESTPSGARLISELGGWQKIHEKVDLGFSPVANDGVLGYVRNIIPDKQSRGLALVLNSNLLQEPDEVIAPVLAHELTHVLHHLDGRISPSLAIPSEFAAHRQQVYVFLELNSNLSPERRENLQSNRKWLYQQFIADLWQDRIRQRFPTVESFRDRYRATKLNYQAGKAYADLQNGVVDVGSPHLDHHLVAPVHGMYTVYTDEKDILDEVNARRGRSGYTENQRQEDDRLLGRRAAIIVPMDQLDSDYRAQNGWRLE